MTSRAADWQVLGREEDNHGKKAAKSRTADLPLFELLGLLDDGLHVLRAQRLLHLLRARDSSVGTGVHNAAFDGGGYWTKLRQAAAP